MTIKISSLVLDIYDDTRGEIAKGLPPELHGLRVAPEDEVAKLADHQFALVMKTADGALRRRFPLHDKDSVKLSAAYFEKAKEVLPPEAVAFASAKLAAAAEGKVFPDVAYLDLAKASRQKHAFTDRFFGLTLGDKSHFPLHDETLVKRAMERFPFTVDTLPPQHRWAYARNIEKRAHQLGVEVPEESPIHLYTNPVINLDALQLAVHQRKTAAGQAMDTEVLDQLLAALNVHAPQGELESHDSYLMRKAAQVDKTIDESYAIAVIEAFDKVAGFSKHTYNRGMLDPFAALFKKASFDSSSLIVDGIDLGKVDLSRLSEVLDPAFVEKFKANPVGTYKMLPDPVKQIIKSMGGETPRPVQSGGDPTQLLDPSFADGRSGSRSW